MLRLSFLLPLAAAVLTLAPKPAAALDDWQPITDEDRKLTSKDVNGASAVMLYHEQSSDDNRNTRSSYTRIKILTEKGKQYADVELRYLGSDFHIINVKARTIAPDGTVTPFTGKPFDKTIVKGHGLKYLAKTFTLSNVEVGSIIEWRYSEYWEEFLVAPHWTVQQDLLLKRAKFTYKPYSGSREVMDEHETKDRVYRTITGLPKDVDIKVLPDRTMTLEVKDIPAFQLEEFSPPEDILKSRVDFYYGSDKMSKPAEFWRDQGKYWNKEVERFMAHSSAVESVAASAVAPTDTPEQKVRKIYAFVQKLRNQTYEREEDILAEIAQARAKQKSKIMADDILSKKEGKRDELTRLFVAMVRTQQIPAFLMRVSTRDEYFFNPNVPNWRQLNSEIAIVHLGEKDVFLDPGTRFCPFGLLEWMRTSVEGVRQTAGGGTELGKTPQADYSQALSKRIAQFTISDDGNVKGKITLTWEGQEALGHRLSGFRTDEAGRKKDLEDELKALLPGGAMVKFSSANAWEDGDAPLTAIFEVEVPGFASTTGKRLLFPPALFQVNSRRQFASTDRKNPIYFYYPYRAIDLVLITLPAGLQVESLPQTPMVRTDYAIYKVSRTAAGNKLTFQRDFAIAGFAFTVDHYASLKTFYEGVNSGDGEQVVLTAAAK